MTPTATVHRELDNFESISEFWTHNDTCFVAGLLPMLHSYSGHELSGPAVDAMRADMAAHKDFPNGGTTMSDGDDYVRTVLGLQTVYPPEWHWHPGTQAEAIHQGLIAHAGINGLVLQIGKAFNLPYSEPGVYSHYVGLGGIDSRRGYKVANGDDLLALARNHGHGKTYPARWMTWSEIARAEPTALLAVLHPKVSTVGVPAGWSDDGTTLTAPNGHKVIHGFRVYILASAHWDPSDMPQTDETGDETMSFQVFSKHVLQWVKGSGVTVSEAGPLARYYVMKAA